jgi:hypothetical protein
MEPPKPSFEEFVNWVLEQEEVWDGPLNGCLINAARSWLIGYDEAMDYIGGGFEDSPRALCIREFLRMADEAEKGDEDDAE